MHYVKRMTPPKLTLLQVAVFVLALVVAPSFAQTREPQPYIEKLIAGRPAKLPRLVEFSPACEENSELAQRAVGLTPKTAIFLTCFVHAERWLEFQSGTTSHLYPYIALSVSVPHPSGDYTRVDFEKLKVAAREQLGELLANVEGSRERLREQDANLQARGEGIRRDEYQQAFRGVFPSSTDGLSFSYLVARSAVMTERGQTAPLREVNAVSTLLFAGRLVLVNVVDHFIPSEQGTQARELSKRWLQAFKELN